MRLRPRLVPHTVWQGMERIAVLIGVFAGVLVGVDQILASEQSQKGYLLALAIGLAALAVVIGIVGVVGEQVHQNRSEKALAGDVSSAPKRSDRALPSDPVPTSFQVAPHLPLPAPGHMVSASPVGKMPDGGQIYQYEHLPGPTPVSPYDLRETLMAELKTGMSLRDRVPSKIGGLDVFKTAPDATEADVAQWERRVTAHLEQRPQMQIRFDADPEPVPAVLAITKAFTTDLWIRVNHRVKTLETLIRSWGGKPLLVEFWFDGIRLTGLATFPQERA